MIMRRRGSERSCSLYPGSRAIQATMVLVLLVILSSSIVTAANGFGSGGAPLPGGSGSGGAPLFSPYVESVVSMPSGATKIISEQALTCSNYGSPSVSAGGTYGTYNNCMAACANPANDGTYYSYGVITAPLYCNGKQIPGTPGQTSKTPVIFCVSPYNSATCALSANYCDCQQPSTGSIQGSSSWYRMDFTTTASFTDNHDAHSIALRERTAGTSTWSNYYQSFTCPTGTSCSKTITVHVPLTQSSIFNFGTSSTYCNQTGTGACWVNARFGDLWNNYRYASQSFNIDRIAPVETSGAGSPWFRAPDYVSSSGQAWWRDSVGYTARYNDQTTTADQSGLSSISIAQVNDATSSCPRYGTGSFTNYPVSGLSSSATQTMSYSGAGTPFHVCSYAADRALPAPGNRASMSHTSADYLDGQPPVSTASPAPGLWRAAPFTVSLGCTDTGGSGCKAFHVVSHSGTETASCPAAPYPVASSSVAASCAPNDDCRFSICAYAEDNVAHNETSHTYVYGVDRKAPTIGAFSAPALVTSRGQRWSGAGTVSFSVPLSDGSAADPGSGIASCEYRVTNGGSVGSWQTASCAHSTSTTIGASNVESSTATFSVSVGSSGQCSTQGANTCKVEVRVTDAVGNVRTASYAFGVDLTVPSCRVSNVDVTQTPPINHGYYNASSNTLYYGTPPSPVSYAVTLDSNDSSGAVPTSGVKSIAFPDLTSPGGTNASAPPLYPETFSATRSYAFNASDAQNGTFAFTVTDAVGNAATCDLKLYHDVVGPRVWQGDVNYSRMVAENASVALRYLDLWVHLNATDPSGIQAVEIKERNTTRFASQKGSPPQCDWSQPIDPARDRTIAFVPNGFFGPINSSFSGWSDLAANVTAEAVPGSCLRFYGVVYDGSGNLNTSAPRNKSVAIDAFPGTSPGAACSFFSTFDNCNDRSAYLDLNASRVQQYRTTACPGSCVDGRVQIIDRSGTATSAQGSDVSIQGITAKPWYRNVSAATGYYRLFNISDPTESGSTSRLYNFQATPPDAYKLFYSSAVVPKTIDERSYAFSSTVPPIYTVDFDIGLTPSDCTSSCTLSTDPGIGTCHVGCAGYNGCVNASGGPGFDSSSPAYKALQACDGLPLNAQTSAGGTSYACCTQPLSTPISTLTDPITIANASRIVRNERLVYLNGRIVKMITVLFSHSS